MAYEFTHEAVTTTRQRAVTITQVPPEFTKALDGQWKLVQTKPVYPVLVFHGENAAKEAAIHLAFAKAWGLSKPDGEKVTVVKVHRKDDKDGVLRLGMSKYDPNAPKRGRKTAEKPAE